MAIKAVKTTGTRGDKRVTTLTYKALPKRKTTQRGTCTIETLRQGNVTTVDYLYSPKERKAKRVAKRKPAAKKVAEAKKEDNGSDVVFSNKKVRIAKNVQLHRYQIFFDGIPAENVRAVLKHRNFKWSPREKAWQRALTTDARYTIQEFIEKGLFD